jgi:two-component system, chemotaxis family, chemotaxis protein CheY
MKVLIVDDSSAIRTLIERAIRLCDENAVSCFQAPDGAEALRILSTNPMDLVFVDLHMPNMDGREFLAELKKADRKPIPTIAVVTSERSDETALEISELGASFYLQKPIAPENIKEVYEHVRGRLR